MITGTKNCVSGGAQLDTLGQSGTDLQSLPPLIIRGNGSKPANREALKAKAKKKIITQKLMLNLIDIAKRKKDDTLLNSFWNTYRCQEIIITHDKKIYGKYCKNRYCTICLGIRKAEIINKYLPVISTWDDPQFVTLTVRSPPAKKLPIMMKAMIRAFKKIKERNKKRHSRGNGIKLVGIKSLECNFNATKRTYNPHFHAIVPNMEVAKQLKADWLDIWTKKYCLPRSQKIIKVRNPKVSLIEIIKYSTKIFTEPDPNNKNKEEASHKVYIAAMYNIISAMKGYRLFDRFGFNLPKKETNNSSTTKEVTDYDSWEYDSTKGDWFSVITGDVFADYQVDDKLQNLLSNNIDTELQ